MKNKRLEVYWRDVCSKDGLEPEEQVDGFKKNQRKKKKVKGGTGMEVERDNKNIMCGKKSVWITQGEKWRWAYGKREQPLLCFSLETWSWTQEAQGSGFCYIFTASCSVHWQNLSFLSLISSCGALGDYRLMLGLQLCAVSDRSRVAAGLGAEGRLCPFLITFSFFVCVCLSFARLEKLKTQGNKCQN